MHVFINFVNFLCFQVRSRDELILQLRAEMKTAEQKHRGTQKQVRWLVCVHFSGCVMQFLEIKKYNLEKWKLHVFPFKTAYLAVFKQYFMKKALSFLYYVLLFEFEICLRAFNSLLQFFFIFLSYAEARFSDHPYFFNTSLLYTHRVAHIYSREVPKPAAVFYCWLSSSSIRAMGGVAPCSKALRKLELRKRESLLIHAVPTFSQLVLRLNWETLWLKPDTHFLVTATPSLSLLSVWVCIVSQRKAFLVSILFNFHLFFSFFWLRWQLWRKR